jgi:hypothetical protein
VDEVYKRRDASRRGNEKDDYPESETQTWHPRIPAPPEGFPDDLDQISFELESDEASFLLDRLLKSQEDSLLAFLALNCQPVDCAFPWQHPELQSFSLEHKGLIRYAEFFSTMMQGAAFVYNLMLAELSERQKLEDEHRENLEKWRGRLQNCSCLDLPLQGLWDLTAGRGHTITKRTEDFVSAWHQRVLATGGNVVDDAESRMLIRTRERQLKGVRSRFTNPRARDQWKGYAGVGQMAYRWPNVKTLLLDLHAGLNGGGHA